MKKFLVSMAAVLAFGALATGCGKKPAASASAPAASASAPAAAAPQKAADVGLAMGKAIISADAKAAQALMYLPEKSKDAIIAKLNKDFGKPEAKAMFESIGAEVSVKGLMDKNQKPVDEATLKDGDVAVAMLEIKGTKGALAGKAMDPMPIPMVKTADGWKVIDGEDKETMQALKLK